MNRDQSCDEGIVNSNQVHCSTAEDASLSKAFNKLSLKIILHIVILIVCYNRTESSLNRNESSMSLILRS